MKPHRDSPRRIALQPMSAPQADRGDSNEDAAGLTRRGVLQAMAASLALASGACTREPVEKIYPYVRMPEAGRGGLPAYYASAFVREGHATGVLIGTREGRPIKIEGNPAHPSSGGGTDAFAQASILELWDPDRSASVWQRLAGSEQASAPSTWAAFDAAWRERATALQAAHGRGLAVLTPHFTSPTLGRQLQALLQRFPDALWHRHSALAPTAARAGAQLAFGLECDWRLRFDRARFVCTLDADPFADGPGHLRHARDWALQRAGIGAGAADRAAGSLRTLAIETTPSLFGARADERVALPPAAIEALLDAVHARLVDGAPAAAAPPLATRLAAALGDAGGASLLIVGRSLSARAHAQAAAIHQSLGAIGRTVEAIEPLDRVGALQPGDLASLVESMVQGRVDTLLIAGCNPVYDAPGSLDVAAALRHVPFVAHLGLHRDETARLATWHLPASHDIESWGDARGHDGTATLVQPAILPLHDTRSPLEWLAALAGSTTRAGHDLVQATWRERWGVAASASASDRMPASDPNASGPPPGDAFDAIWRRSLRSGVVEGSAAAPLLLPAAQAVAAPGVPGVSDATSPAGAPPGIVAVFTADAAADAGRFANNGWLQELPRPFTALTWDNAVLIGPQTAGRLGVTTGDVLRLGAGGRTLEAPAWVLAEHAEGAVTLTLGQGRRAAGRVGNGVGYDAHVLRRADGGPVPVAIERSGERHRFAVTQHRLDQQGRELARSVVGAAALPVEKEHPSLYARMASPEHAWAMTIDLDACIGCNACTIACQAENNIPVVGAEQVARGREMHWIRVDRYAGADEAAGSVFQPVPCMHCEDAPCEVVCPVGATVHDSEGLNVQVYNRCVGTRFCSNNCPYKVRRFNFLKYEDDTTETLKAMKNPDVTVRQRGVMEKCTYCVQRLSRARLGAEKSGTPLADGDVVTACQSACPTRAIHFGDLRDAASDVVRAKASPRHYAMLDELNTRPRTTYLARVVRPPSGVAGGGMTVVPNTALRDERRAAPKPARVPSGDRPMYPSDEGHT